ncbi:MAG: tyrosine protein kinase, partial [Flavobacterium sp.]|nr:tyrosine protein kinase [Flavobacterium sp.]
MNTTLPTKSDFSDDINIKEIIFDYLQYWKWFVVSVLLCFIAVFSFLRYNIVQYNVKTTILIKDEKKGGTSELSAFSDLNIFSGKTNIENELAIFKSRKLSKNVVNQLDLDISYFIKGRVVEIELYKTAPVKIIFVSKNSDYENGSLLLNIEILNATKFICSDAENQKRIEYNFGQKIKSSLGEFVIVLTNGQIGKDTTVKIIKSSQKDIAVNYSGGLGIVNLEKTNVVEITFINPVTDKGIDYENELVNQFNLDAIKDRNEVAENTSKFIKDRLILISNELDVVENTAEAYKKSNKLTNIESDAELDVQLASDYEKKELEIETQVKVGQYMLESVRNANIDALIPTNVISATETSSSYINEYNKLILEKKRIGEKGTALHPMIQNLNTQLTAFKTNIIESLLSRQNDLLISKRNLTGQKNRFDGKISQIPSHEKNYNAIARQQKIKETLYLYLLQKREETEISLAVTSPKAKIIDSAYLVGSVEPKRMLFYLGAFLLGLLIPGAIIYLKDLLDTKIKYRKDVEGKVSIPFLGELPKAPQDELVVKPESRSSASEALRMIRTNLEFTLADLDAKLCKTIFVTSTIPKEGKTFFAVNFATTL